MSVKSTTGPAAALQMVGVDQESAAPVIRAGERRAGAREGVELLRL